MCPSPAGKFKRLSLRDRPFLYPSPNFPLDKTKHFQDGGRERLTAPKFTEMLCHAHRHD